MRIFGIDKIVSWHHTDEIRDFHSVMFHGEAERPGAPLYTPEYHGHGEGRGLPLSIRRPGNAIPAICEPQSNLVVRVDLAEQLRRIPHVKMLRVNFASLFEMAYPKGDMSWYRNLRGDPSKFAQTAPDERARFEPVAEYFEVFDDRYGIDIKGPFDGCRTYRFDGIELDVGFEDCGEIQVSEQLMRQHPLISNPFQIVSEEVFVVLDPHLDRDFFKVVEAVEV